MDETKKCPFNPELACEDCRLYAFSGRYGDVVKRCIFEVLSGGLLLASIQPPQGGFNGGPQR